MSDPWERNEALVRQESEVRVHLELNPDATSMLRTRLIMLLDTMTEIARDDDLWATMANTKAPTPTERFGALTKLAAADLGALLTAFGYRHPPSPPVNELVDSTIEALADAAGAEGDRRELIKVAQQQLVSFCMRVRKQLNRPTTSATPSQIRQQARWTVRAARELIPVTISAVVAAYTGEAFTVLAGVIAAKTIEKLAEHGAKLAAETVLGKLMHSWLRPRSRTEADDEPDPALEPLALHLAAIHPIIGQLKADADLTLGLPGYLYAERQFDDRLCQVQTHLHQMRGLVDISAYSPAQQRKLRQELQFASELLAVVAGKLNADPQTCVQVIKGVKDSLHRLHNALDHVDAGPEQLTVEELRAAILARVEPQQTDSSTTPTQARAQARTTQT